MSRCASCQEPIRWVRSSDGKAMPLNLEPDDERGNVLVALVGGEEIATVLADEHELRYARTMRQPLYLAHFATCPSAGEHRRLLRSA